MREKREIFKKATLPTHDDVDSDSDYQDITKPKEVKPSKKLSMQRKSSKHHVDRQTEYKRKESSVIPKRRKMRQQPEQRSSKKTSKIEERRSFINSKNRLTMGIYNQGKQSHTIYREPGLSKVFEKMSRKSKDKTKEDMSKVLDCSSFQIKPLQACIGETTLDDFNLPASGSSHHSPKDLLCDVDVNTTRTSSSIESAHNSMNEPNMMVDISEKMELASEPHLEDITHRLMSTLQPHVTFGKDHLQDIRNELKEYYRKSTLQQDRCDGRILQDTSNHPSATPVRIGKVPIAGKKLFPSSIRKIGRMSRDFEKSTEDFCQGSNGNCSKLSAQENAIPYNETLDEYITKQQPDKTQHIKDTKHSYDILSIIDEQYSKDLVELSKYAIISPLKKPSMDIPPPDKPLPRKLF